jgi:hypothetical protein
LVNHAELHVEINSASRDAEKLSLLRAFFFWLQVIVTNNLDDHLHSIFIFLVLSAFPQHYINVDYGDGMIDKA